MQGRKTLDVPGRSVGSTAESGIWCENIVLEIVCYSVLIGPSALWVKLQWLGGLQHS